jgi:cell division protein FtsL
MLETKPQTIGRTARATPLRSLASPSFTGRTATAHAIPAPERDARTAERAARRAVGGRTRSQRMDRSEARLLAWTVSAAILVCGLLVVYLAAYARVTTLGLAQSKMRAVYRAEWQENQLLRAQEAALKSPYRIADRAERLGLTKDHKRVDYIPPSVSMPDAPAPIMLGAAAQADAFADSNVTTTTAGDAVANKAGSEADSQGTDSGTTKDDNSADRHD